MGDKKWANSGTTPDWMDVEASIRAIDGIHLGMTMVTILPAGAGSSGGLHIAITSHWEVLPGSVAISEVITERTVAEHSCEAIPAIVLTGLYAHDFAIGQAYQQRDFSQKA
jgi:hypothetical protein